MVWQNRVGVLRSYLKTSPLPPRYHLKLEDARDDVRAVPNYTEMDDDFGEADDGDG
jgi:hypothetical protein